MAPRGSSRRTQPYRKGAATRTPGLAREAMLRGAAAFGPHPMDARRALARSYRKRTARGLVAAVALRRR